MAVQIHDTTHEVWKWTLIVGGALVVAAIILVSYYAQ